MCRGRSTRLVALTGVSLVVTACGAVAPTVPTVEPFRPVRIVALPSGNEVGAEDFYRALLDARAIYVGERHDSAADHRAQAWVIEELAARDPSFALGLEMVQRPFQSALDAWAAHSIDDDALLRDTEWAERWHLDFALYRPILDAARRAGASIVALNAPREWTRAISRGGLDALDGETRAALPELDLGDAEHRAMVLEALSEHPGHGEGAMDVAMLERFYVAQTLWDETMGAGVAEVLGASDAPHRMVVVAGRMHVQQGLGIPRCAARRLPGLTSVVILPLTDAEARAEALVERPLSDFALVVE